MKRFIRKYTPRFVISLYHRFLSWVAAVRYRHPSRELIVVGITGTKGKSTTSNILWHLLTEAGYTVGLTGTINYRIGDREWISKNKMTMVGRFQMQKLLREMVDAGCEIAIVETTSEGVLQWRHKHIDYDIVAITNLSPEHIEAHGNFENYKQAKLDIFRHAASRPTKTIDGKDIVRASFVNSDDEHWESFYNVPMENKVKVGSSGDVVMTDIVEHIDHTTFLLDGHSVRLPLLGSWNARNAAMAASIAMILDVPITQTIVSLSIAPSIPGRMEFIDEGQDFSVIVDYAYEPVSLELLFRFCRKLIPEGAKIITLISSTGGGRDVRRRPLNGKVAGELCDVVFVTDEDPYDDDPQEIIDQVAEGVLQAGKVEGVNMWRVLDRKEAIEKAIAAAKTGDVVLLTAKGAEQKMCVADGKKIDWDDREYAKNAIKQRNSQ